MRAHLGHILVFLFLFFLFVLVVLFVIHHLVAHGFALALVIDGLAEGCGLGIRVAGSG